MNVYKELKPQTVVEIGVYQGGTLYQWIKHAPHATRIIAIDPIQPAKTVEQWFSWCDFQVNLTPIEKPSHQALDWVKEHFPVIDFLFIDGDHSYEGAKQDFLNYAPLVRPGGIIALHDINPVPPDGPWKTEMWKVWTEIRQAGYLVRELNAAPDIYGIGVVIKE